MLLAHFMGVVSGDDSGRGERRRVILVAGICTENPAKSMPEIYKWLQDDLDYNPTEILLFDYRSGTPLSPTGKYAQLDTLISIDGVGGSAANLRGLINTQASPGEKFDIIAHSLGGVVSLYAALDPVTGTHIHSIVTIESPVQGVGIQHAQNLTDLLNWMGATCATSNDPSVKDLISDSDVVSQIMGRDWKNAKFPFVVTVANTQDSVISNVVSPFCFPCFPNGERGILANAWEWTLQNLGGDLLHPVEAHGLPLNVTSNPAAGPVRDKLLRALVEYELKDLFLAGDAYLRPSLSKPDITTRTTLTRTFFGNQDALLHPALSKAGITTLNTLTRTFVGNQDALLHPAMSRADITTLAAFCTGDLSVSFTAGTVTYTIVRSHSVAMVRAVVATAQGEVARLKKESVPVADPPVAETFTVSGVPAQGVIGLLVTLTTGTGGIICWDFETVDTGAPSGAGVSIPAALPSCTLDLSLSFATGNLTYAITRTNSVDMVRAVFGTGQGEVVRLKKESVPAAASPVGETFTVSAVPALGVVGLLATLTTGTGGIICWDFETVNAGAAPASAAPVASPQELFPAARP
jgi:pimeloyl-ACP methyl ester carboxylesterase